MSIDEDIPVAAALTDVEICQAVREQCQALKVDDSDGDGCVEENPPTNAEMRQALDILKRGEYLDHQRKMEEEQKERRDMERLEQLKKKEKHEQSEEYTSHFHIGRDGVVKAAYESCYIAVKKKAQETKYAGMSVRRDHSFPRLCEPDSLCRSCR
ncbi:hypothetical protein AVEN_243163-1 [Araneus ventricosus]|uniref:Uncharacterized protein n=1 Tax=Araneus ventricosus TaxID=182803 RepID=A0A4Y2WAQ5_ARAVE|nr:hypothetical protein AVEN_243163-1 [Araneus ventricosus]